MIAIDDLEIGKGKNQIGTPKHASDTRWGSHLSFIRSLVIIFDTTCFVLKNVIKDENSCSQRSEVDVMTSFEFIFILHLMRERLRIMDDLSQALQCKSQDIPNAMHLVSLTKKILQKFRDGG